MTKKINTATTLRPWRFVPAFVFITIGIAAAGYAYFQHQKEELVLAMRNELAVTAEDLKIHFRDTSARRIS